MNKLISIVVCTYNGEAYMAEVIDSILHQEEFDEIVDKVIIVDNASTDKTKEIISKYKEKNSAIEYVYEPNKGVSNARKHAAYVNTEWVAYIDDDNIIMPKWLINAKKFIRENPSVGVFNGASIPQIRFNATEKELTMLKIIYPNLACTHIDHKEYLEGVEEKLKYPFGAGMVLRTDGVKTYLGNGWTKNIGRKGEELGSGEDGEIAAAVLKEGYQYGFNHEMSLWHIIPQKRLEDNYVKKLYKGLDIGYYNYISYSENYLIRRLKIACRSFVGIMLFPLRIMANRDPIKKTVLKFGLVSKFRFLSYTFRDLFILKRNLK